MRMQEIKQLYHDASEQLAKLTESVSVIDSLDKRVSVEFHEAKLVVTLSQITKYEHYDEIRYIRQMISIEVEKQMSLTLLLKISKIWQELLETERSHYDTASAGRRPRIENPSIDCRN
jgi:ribosome maturation protein Sdo1